MAGKIAGKRTSAWNLALGLAVGAATLLAGCAPNPRSVNPPTVRTAPPSPQQGMQPVHGDWLTGQALVLRNSPSNGAAVLVNLPAGQPVKLLGRQAGSDWVAVQRPNGGMGWVRTHQLRLRDSTAFSGRGTSATVARPQGEAVPTIRSAPRGKIQATPISE